MKRQIIITAIATLVAGHAAIAQNQQIPDDATFGYAYAHSSAHGKWPALATSPDAIHFHDMLCGDSVFSPMLRSQKSDTETVHLSRTLDGKAFLMAIGHSDGTMNIMISDDLSSWHDLGEYGKGTSPKITCDSNGYVLYYSKGGAIWYRRIDSTFMATGSPARLFDPGTGAVEAEIVETDGGYVAMISTLGSGFLRMESKSLTSEWSEPVRVAGPEGSDICGHFSALRVKDQKGWQLGYYNFTKKAYRLCSADEKIERLFAPKNIEGTYGPSLGSFLRLTENEYKKIQEWSDKYEYVHLDKDVKNPIFPALHADPEVMYSEQTGKFYIYPTTDGAYGWHSFDFHCLSSENFVDWKDEGVILDLRDLKWGDREYAWAPCIIEKPVYKKDKLKGWKYYFYFVHHGTIGVAVAGKPEGPFKDVLGKALLTQEEIHAPNQIIDPDVFQDPKTGKYYLYWGNSYLWMAELADDMISLVPGTMHELIPRAKIGEYHYLEGSYVFERNGLYYFMWSENITRSSYYRVRYLISDSPTELVRNGEPAKVEETIVIQQDPEHQIFGTGHHSVICMPGTDDWYIVYHRFTRPEGVKMGLSGGYNREVCIDRMYFNPDGTIQPVKPSL